MRAIAKQAQGDIHPDLGAAAGEQGTPAGEIGARLPLGMAERRALRTQLVIEGVDLGVMALADIAGPRLEQGARAGCGRRRGQRDAAGLVVDAIRRAGGGRGDHRAVGVGDLGPLGVAARFLHGLEHARGRTTHGDEIGMGLLKGVQLGQNVESHPQSLRIDT